MYIYINDFLYQWRYLHYKCILVNAFASQVTELVSEYSEPKRSLDSVVSIHNFNAPMAKWEEDT